MLGSTIRHNLDNKIVSNQDDKRPLEVEAEMTQFLREVDVLFLLDLEQAC